MSEEKVLLSFALALLSSAKILLSFASALLSSEKYLLSFADALLSKIFAELSFANDLLSKAKKIFSNFANLFSFRVAEFRFPIAVNHKSREILKFLNPKINL